MNDKKLVSLCIKSDEKALKLLYERYSPLMMGISIRYTGNVELAKDILHDSFIKIFGSINKFQYKGEGSLKAWISRIVINTAITSLKKQNNFLSIEEYNLNNKAEESATDSEEIDLYNAVDDKIIINYVGKLPTRLRVIFNMYMFDDMSHNDIAEKLKITESASRVRLHRAKSILAENLRTHLKMISNERR